jgi:AsmA family protein
MVITMTAPAQDVSFVRRHLGWMIFLGCLVIVVIAAVLFDWNWFRPWVEAGLSAALGRAATIDHLSVKLSRAPLVTLDHIVVANPPDFPPDSHMGEIDKLSMRLDLRNLLHGTVVIPELTIDHPVSRLERGPSGEPNWKLAAIPSGNSSAAPAQIGRLTINDGHAHLSDPVIKSDVEMTLKTEIGADGVSEVVLQGKGTYDGVPTTINLRGGSLLALRQADVRYPVDLRWDVGPTHMRLTGTVDDPASFAGLDGMLDMSGPDLAKLYPMLGLAMPPSPPYHLKGKIAYADRLVRFTNFNGSLGSSDLNGTLSVDTTGDKPRLDGHLNSRKLVFADLAGFVGGEPGKPDAPNATPQRKAVAEENKASDKTLPSRRIDLAKLNSMNAHVVYSGKRIQADYLPIDDLTADLTLENGRLQLQPLNFGVGKGTIALKVDIDSRVDPPHVSVSTDFRHLDFRRIMQQTKIFEGVGTVGGHADVVSNGSSLAEILARGDGGITLIMGGGEISALLMELAGLEVADALGVAVTDKNAKYKIRCMVADSDLHAGVATLKTLVFDTTDTTLIGTGALDFRDESLKVKVEAHPKDPSILTFHAPVDVGGTLKHPTAIPDPAATSGRVAAMVGLGILLPGIGALIPTIELGLGKDSDCAGMIAAAKRVDPVSGAQNGAAPFSGNQNARAAPPGSQKAAVPPAGMQKPAVPPSANQKAAAPATAQ